MKKNKHARPCLMMVAGVFVLAAPNAQADGQAFFPANQQTQQADTPTPDVQAPMDATAPQDAVVTPQEPVDPLLTTHEAAVECALAQIVETAGQHHRAVGNPLNATYKAGLCAGKIQSFILTAQAAHPSCFPKISLEEGISMFMKWAEAHRNQGGSSFLDGFERAFAESVPCMRK
jgi:hypothetical protein